MILQILAHPKVHTLYGIFDILLVVSFLNFIEIGKFHLGRN